MTIWTLEQIHRVRGLRASQAVSMTEIDLAPEAVGYTKDLIFKQLASAAHAHAVELHQDDITFTTSDDDTTLARRFTGRWAPATREVVIEGGEHDGTTMTVPDLRPIRLALRRRAAWAPEADATSTVSAEDTRLVSLAGWNETERHWIYRQDAS